MEQINRHDLEKYFPGASASVVAANSKGVSSADTGNPRPHSVIQKQQDVDSSKPESIGPCAPVGKSETGGEGIQHSQDEADDVNYETGLPGGDGTDRGQFRVTITVRFSNRRRTDLSGKLDTILDCLVNVQRRLLGSDSRNSHQGGTSRAGSGGGDDNNSKAVRKYGKISF
jgi:hypothetical protein